ncbi:MAG: hypothetical protein HKM95_03825, partial [Inquilinus sp.]|nr:hypothetical protein [Inquilinus sp.]
MSAGGSPARQLLLYVEDEAALEDLPIAEVNGDLAALGIDPAALIALARKRAEPPAAPPRPAAPTVPVAEPEKPDEVSYHVAEPAPDIMADMRIRPSGSPDDDEQPRRRGGAVWVLAGLLVVAAAAGFGALKLWPEVADLDRLVAMVGPAAEQPAAEADEPFVPAGEAVVVSRLEPVPPP